MSFGYIEQQGLSTDRNIILNLRNINLPNLSKSLYVKCGATIRFLPTRPYWHFLTRNILVVHWRSWFHSQIISNLSQETSISVGLGLNSPLYHQVCQLLISLDGKILGDFQTQCYVSWSLHPSQAVVGRHQDKVLTTTFGKSGYATLARVLLHPSRLWTERVWSTQQHHQAISKKETQFKQIFHEIYGTVRIYFKIMHFQISSSQQNLYLREDLTTGLRGKGSKQERYWS